MITFTKIRYSPPPFFLRGCRLQTDPRYPRQFLLPIGFLSLVFFITICVTHIVCDGLTWQREIYRGSQSPENRSAQK
jgi:hypothetical protein